MIRVIEGLPDSVVAVSGVGEVSSDDYVSTLDPAIDAALEKYDKIRLLYVLGDDFDRYSGGAMWQDTKVGLSHWTSFEKIAVVTDEDWIENGVKAFGWMIPGEVKTFDDDDLDEAKAWIVS